MKILVKVLLLGWLLIILAFAGLACFGPGLGFMAECAIGSARTLNSEEVIATLARSAPAFHEQVRATAWDARGVDLHQFWEGHYTWLVASLASASDVESMKRAVVERMRQEAEGQGPQGNEADQVTEGNESLEFDASAQPRWWDHDDVADREVVVAWQGHQQYELWVFSRAQTRVWARFSF